MQGMLCKCGMHSSQALIQAFLIPVFTHSVQSGTGLPSSMHAMSSRNPTQLLMVSSACTGWHAVAAKQGAVAHLAALARDLNAKSAAAEPALVAAVGALAAALGCDDARAKLTDADAVLLCKVLAQHAGE